MTRNTQRNAVGGSKWTHPWATKGYNCIKDVYPPNGGPKLGGHANVEVDELVVWNLEFGILKRGNVGRYSLITFFQA